MFLVIDGRPVYFNSDDLLNLLRTDMERYFNPASPFVRDNEMAFLAVKGPFKMFFQKPILQHAAKILGIGEEHWQQLKPDRREDILYSAFQHIMAAVALTLEGTTLHLDSLSRESAPPYVQNILASGEIPVLAITSAEIHGHVFWQSGESGESREREPASLPGAVSDTEPIVQ